MNFLQLAQLVREKCGISGTGPVSVVGQKGEDLRVVNWTNEAWEQIQKKNAHWRWMRREFAFQTVPSVREYTPVAAGIDDLARWHADTLRSYLTANGAVTEQYMVEFDWANFRDTYLFGAQQVQTGFPRLFAIRPGDKALVTDYLPNDIYTIRGEYQQRALRMAANDDTPGLFPEEHHMAIVHRAVMLYAEYEGAGALYAAHASEFRLAMGDLADDQLEQVTAGGAFA